MNSHIAFVGSVVLALLAPAAHAAQQVFDRTIAVSPGGRLTVDADSSDVSVTGTNADQVVVHIEINASQDTLDSLKLAAESNFDGVNVTIKNTARGLKRLWGGGQMQGKVTVQVPRRYSVDLKTSGGNLVVTQIEGDAFGKTSGGNIRLGNLKGAVRMRTSGGNVTLDDLQGDAELHTSGGHIGARKVRGDVDLETSGGGIQLEEITGSVKAHTSSGHVTARRVRGNVDLHTSGGNVNAEAIEGAIRADTSGGSVHVDLIGPNRGVHATTSGGDIVMTVPEGITGNLDASTAGGSISSDVPITTRTAGNSRLSGEINGGGETIHARTSGGNIRIRQRAAQLERE
jgi:hypothetical protein